MTRTALILAHGQPSDPDPAEATLAALGRAVALHLPGWQVLSATLATSGALEAALTGAASPPLVLPFFMADGWFTLNELPRRLVQAGQPQLPRLPAFGLWPQTLSLAARVAQQAAAAAGWAEAETRLIFAAHGSGRSPAPAEAAAMTARATAAATGFTDIRLGFIEQAPPLAEALRAAPPKSILLPLFVARWGHVETDLPAAIRQSAFPGLALPPIGTHAEVPAMLAGALAAATPP